MKFIVIMLGLCPIIVLGQSSTINTAVRPKQEAHAIEQQPEIDGEVINDPIWQQVAPFSDFIQSQPNFGLAISEKTEVRIAYDAETFY